MVLGVVYRGDFAISKVASELWSHISCFSFCCDVLFLLFRVHCYLVVDVRDKRTENLVSQFLCYRFCFAIF